MSNINFEFQQEYHFDCDTKWKIEYVDILMTLTNRELLDEVLQRQVPDDYDGCFTEEASWKAKKSKMVLISKLEKINFL